MWVVLEKKFQSFGMYKYKKYEFETKDEAEAFRLKLHHPNEIYEVVLYKKNEKEVIELRGG